MQLILPSDWHTHLENELNKPYMLDLETALSHAYSTREIYPAKEQIFSAFEMTPLKKVKVVILGQDPYHGENQAHGLSFSVQDEVKIPPSLRNIYKEISSDIGPLSRDSGNLTEWAKQGVFLLNSTLTVEAGAAGSHHGWGWETFTDEVIRVISREQKHVVFLLWGKFAQDKTNLIDESKHLILKTTHPSPLSAYRGFIGCKHFSAANASLQSHDMRPIQWT
jgi:uracil-DNA glycosylase